MDVQVGLQECGELSWPRVARTYFDHTRRDGEHATVKIDDFDESDFS